MSSNDCFALPPCPVFKRPPKLLLGQEHYLSDLSIVQIGLKPCVHLPQMGARTTCRVFKSDNMLLLYFKLIFTTTHHFQLFGGRIEKPDVNLLRHCSFTPSQSSPSCDPQQVPVSRSKRKVDQSKTSCLLHLHADYRFYKRFGSVEAVVAQVSSHSAQKIHSTLI